MDATLNRKIMDATVKYDVDFLFRMIWPIE